MFSQSSSNSYLGFQALPNFFFLHQFLLLSMMLYGMEYPFVLSEFSSSFLPTLASMLQGGG